eukprot:CAMPEP_0168415104 /NCGR_PEP_ID=MMETSP0228-20121227/30064_1 /TAXON_ID=133427 /ORGANISM="Protoceratium reticulatum, Strain CCCM 535 (=CCMP 1889)" /LENGTH=138 /DNA_ID=CAMNT_0008428911 /DNA_START=1 /DNA_END=413 /DNA_ORIENTATION=+
MAAALADLHGMWTEPSLHVTADEVPPVPGKSAAAARPPELRGRGHQRDHWRLYSGTTTPRAADPADAFCKGDEDWLKGLDIAAPVEERPCSAQASPVSLAALDLREPLEAQVGRLAEELLRLRGEQRQAEARRAEELP